MLRSWKASTLWSFDFFKQRYGSDVVTLSDGRFRALTQLPLAQCIDLILRMDLRDTYKYCGATPTFRIGWCWISIQNSTGISKCPSGLTTGSGPSKKPSFPVHRIMTSLSSAGPAGATTYIHRDRHRTHAWLAQIVGRKRWTIFPPDQVSLVYNKDFESGAPPFVNISRSGSGKLSWIQGRVTN